MRRQPPQPSPRQRLADPVGQVVPIRTCLLLDASALDRGLERTRRYPHSFSREGHAVTNDGPLCVHDLGQTRTRAQGLAKWSCPGTAAARLSLGLGRRVGKRSRHSDGTVGRCLVAPRHVTSMRGPSDWTSTVPAGLIHEPGRYVKRTHAARRALTPTPISGDGD